MGGRLVDGQWVVRSTWEKDSTGNFQRQESRFRKRMEPGGPFPPVAGRYHLYVSLACPWAHRVLMVRSLMGLEDVFPVSTVHPVMGDDGWVFDGADIEFPTPDHENGKRFLREIYLAADPAATGRVTVPVVWDTHNGTIVNNESREIIRDLAIHFTPLATRESDLYPEKHRDAIDAAMDAFYEPVNNGVYRCGFAGTQDVLESSVASLFEALDYWNAHLEKHPYLVGESLTLADIALFATLVRFDPVYYVHFKTNLRHIYEYPGLWRMVCELVNHPLIGPTVAFDHIKHHYFRSHPVLNPRGFVPSGPVLTYA